MKQQNDLIIFYLGLILREAKTTLSLLNITNKYFPDIVRAEIRSTEYLISTIENATNYVESQSSEKEHVQSI